MEFESFDGIEVERGVIEPSHPVGRDQLAVLRYAGGLAVNMMVPGTLLRLLNALNERSVKKLVIDYSEISEGTRGGVVRYDIPYFRGFNDGSLNENYRIVGVVEDDVSEEDRGNLSPSIEDAVESLQPSKDLL